MDLAQFPPDKQFRIGEVARIFNLEPHVLRYWEKEFPVLNPRKTNTNQRSYDRRDIEIIAMIKYLLYTEQYTVNGAVEKLEQVVHLNLSLSETQECFQSIFNTSSTRLSSRTLTDAEQKQWQEDRDERDHLLHANDNLLRENLRLRAQLAKQQATLEALSHEDAARRDICFASLETSRQTLRGVREELGDLLKHSEQYRLNPL